MAPELNNASQKPRMLIIGLGNAHRGDDAIGLIAAQRLRALGLDAVIDEAPGVDGAALMERWAGADSVVVIDAVSSGDLPGTLHRIDAVQEPIPTALRHTSTHALSVAAAIELSRALHRLPCCLIVYGVEVGQCAPGSGLSSAVEAALPALLQHIALEARSTLRLGPRLEPGTLAQDVAHTEAKGRPERGGAESRDDTHGATPACRATRRWEAGHGASGGSARPSAHASGCLAERSRAKARNRAPHA